MSLGGGLIQAFIIVASLCVAGCGAPSDTGSAALTDRQKEAVKSARQYLRQGSMSRNSLILHMSSEFGEGYDVADVTTAVDSLDVDWNQNAARAAKAYLDRPGITCDRLVAQLSAESGEQYTYSQARFGAQAAGVC